MMFKRLWSMLTLFFVSAGVYAGGKQASPYPEFSDDSVLLRFHNQENTDASTEIVEAAQRMFKHVNLRGKKADWIKQTLGKPFKTVGLKERIAWVYQFVGPKKTVGCTLHFDAVGYKVTRVLGPMEEHVAFGFDPLVKPLLPLPDQEYERILNAPSSKEKISVKLLYQGLVAGQMTVRARSALLLGDQGNRSSVPYLIEALCDQSRHDGANYPDAGMATTRYWANESLKKLTKQDFGFVWNDPEEKRNKSIQRWREWYLQGLKIKP